MAVELPESLVTLRDQAKNGLFIGALASLREQTDLGLKALYADKANLHAFIDACLERSSPDGRWMAGAIDELAEELAGDRKLAGNVFRLHVLDTKADYLCNMMYVLQQAEVHPQSRTLLRPRIRQVKRNMDLYIDDLAEAIGDMSSAGKVVAEAAIYDYIEAIHGNITRDRGR